MVFKTDEAIAENNKRMAALTGYKPDTVKKAVLTVKNEISKQNGNQPQQPLLSFIPTSLARTSPFFILSRKSRDEEQYKGKKFKHSWGEISITGQKLGINDETILLGLLSLAKKSSTVTATKNAICKAANISPSKPSYILLNDSVQRLKHTVVDVTVIGNNKKPKIVLGGAIISNSYMDENKYIIQINEYFLEMFVASFTTYIDMTFRAKLKRDASKALYRFYQSQKNNYFSCQFVLLAKTINLNDKIPHYKNREAIKNALRELKENGFLSKWTYTKKTDAFSAWKKKTT